MLGYWKVFVRLEVFVNKVACCTPFKSLFVYNERMQNSTKVSQNLHNASFIAKTHQIRNGTSKLKGGSLNLQTPPRAPKCNAVHLPARQTEAGG